MGEGLPSTIWGGPGPNQETPLRCKLRWGFSVRSLYAAGSPAHSAVSHVHRPGSRGPCLTALSRGQPRPLDQPAQYLRKPGRGFGLDGFESSSPVPPHHQVEPQIE